eukprot:TRINITY_DN7957_c0_g1_i1.p1 TRINITY_DN7957_c0_g1~~TRINITY_DN7957_c0_g1_i1.p1  ORF type:complete len:1944 (+),score=310.39 TRINITY_DN7957_c0_g1_i1:316-5832(+)
MTPPQPWGYPGRYPGHVPYPPPPYRPGMMFQSSQPSSHQVEMGHDDSVDMEIESPEHSPERIPERISERIPERIPERTPERTPDRTPERTPERMPDSKTTGANAKLNKPSAEQSSVAHTNKVNVSAGRESSTVTQTKESVPKKGQALDPLDSIWRTTEDPLPPTAKFLVPLRANSSADTKVLEFLGKMKEQVAHHKRAEENLFTKEPKEKDSEVEKAMQRLRQKIREKQDEMNRVANMDSNGTASTKQQQPTPNVTKKQILLSSAAKSADVVPPPPPPHNKSDETMVIDDHQTSDKASEDKMSKSESKSTRSEDKSNKSEEKASRIEDKRNRSDDKARRSEDKTNKNDEDNERRIFEEKLMVAEAARGNFMKEEQTLKDWLSKLHQTESQLNDIQSDLDDTVYAEASANKRILFLQDQLRKQVEFLDQVKHRHRQLLAERDKAEARRSAQQREFERIQRSHDINFSDLVSIEADVEVLETLGSGPPRARGLKSKSVIPPAESTQQKSQSVPRGQSDHAEEVSPAIDKESRLREMLLQSLGNKAMKEQQKKPTNEATPIVPTATSAVKSRGVVTPPNPNANPSDVKISVTKNTTQDTTPVAAAPATATTTSIPATPVVTATPTNTNSAIIKKTVPVASNTLTVPPEKQTAAVVNVKKRPREAPEPTATNKKATISAPAPKKPTDKPAISSAECAALTEELLHSVMDMLEPHWWAKVGTSAFNFNIHTFFPLSSYLKEQNQGLPTSTEAARFLNKGTLSSLQNPFAFLGKPSKKSPGNIEVPVVEQVGESDTLMKEYQSPLMMFKSYRLSPNYPLKLNSNTHSHKIDPYNTLCRFDLHGVCNDDECPWQHLRDYQLDEKDLAFDLADYIAAAPAVNEKKQLTAEEKQRLLDSMGEVVLETLSEKTPRTLHHKASDLVKKVNKIRGDGDTSLVLGRRRHMLKVVNKNKKFPKGNKKSEKPAIHGKEASDSKVVPRVTVEPKADQTSMVEDKVSEVDILLSSRSMDEEYDSDSESDILEKKILMLGAEDSHDEWDDSLPSANRYWDSESNATTSLEEATVSKSNRPEVWLAYAFNGVDKESVNDPAVRNRILSVLSRGLEKNRNASSLWIPYLCLFKGLRDTKVEEVSELAHKAAKFCRDSVVLWLFYISLPVHDSVEKRESCCVQALSTLIKLRERKAEPPSEKLTEKEEQYLSWGIFALIVHLIQVFVDSGNLNEATRRLKELIWNASPFGTLPIRSLLSPRHLCLLLLYYIHLLFFGEFPASHHLQRVASSDDIHLNSMMIINWSASTMNATMASETVGKSNAKEIRQAFEDSLDLLNSVNIAKNKDLSLPIEVNYILMELSLCNQTNDTTKGNYYRSLCQRFLRSDPKRITLWYLYACGEDALEKYDSAEKIFSKSLTHFPQGFMLWYHRVLYALKLGNKDKAKELLAECVLQFVDKGSVKDTSATFSFICSAYARLLNISDYTLGGRNSTGSDWITLKFNISTTEQRALRQDVYLWLLFFLFLADNEFNESAATEDSSSEQRESQWDSLSVVFSCALYRLQNKHDQDLVWLHYFYYQDVKGIKTDYLLSLLERYLSEQDWNEGPDNFPLSALLMHGLDTKVPALDPFTNLKALVPSLLVKDRTISNSIIQLVLNNLPTSAWSDLLTKLIHYQPTNQVLLRTITDYSLSQLAGQSLSTKNKVTLPSLLDVLLAKHPLFSDLASARTSSISSKTIRHHLRLPRSFYNIAVKKQQKLDVDQRLMLIAFAVLSTSSRDHATEGEQVEVGGDLTFLLDLCLKSIEVHPANKMLWKLLDCVKRVMVGRGFTSIPSTFPSKFIPVQAVSAMDTKKAAKERGIDL